MQQKKKKTIRNSVRIWLLAAVLSLTVSAPAWAAQEAADQAGDAVQADIVQADVLQESAAQEDVAQTDPSQEDSAGEDAAPAPVSMPGREDGEYEIDVAMEGGTGRASITSPARLIIRDGAAYAQIEWSSPYYDYMKIGDTRYDPVNTDGNTRFEIPVTAMNAPMDVIADTTAMSEPHEIAYALTFDENSITGGPAEQAARASRIGAIAAVVVIAAIILISIPLIRRYRAAQQAAQKKKKKKKKK